MRRETLFNALNRVVTDLRDSGLIPMFESALESLRSRGTSDRPDQSVPQWVSFDVFQRLAVAFTSYGEAERKILEEFGLAPIMSPEFWNRLNATEPTQIWSIQQKLEFAVKHAPRLLGLIKQEYVEELKSEENDIPETLRGKEVFTVILGEEGLIFSSPERITHMLMAVSLLYRAHARLHGFSGDDLAVISCDSGSDKSFDFLGVAAVIQGLRQTAVDIYDRRLLGRQKQMSANIDLVAQSLPVLGEIAKMATSGTITPQEAEVLKRQVLQGATKFLEAGAFTNEMTHQGFPSARALMQPEQKLLAPPTVGPAEDRTHESEEHESSRSPVFSMETEIEKLHAEIERLKGRPRTKPRQGNPVKR